MDYLFQKVRDWINEPASLLPEIVKSAESRSEKSTDLNLVYCRLSKQLPDHLDVVSKDLLTIIENMNFNGIMNNEVLYILLKKKRFTNMNEIYRKYWDKVTDDLVHLNANHSEMDAILSNISSRYCLIRKGSNNQLRYPKLESILRELALMEIKHGVSGWKPNRLGRLATFLIGFAHDPSTDYVLLPEYLVQKIEEMSTQFNIKEIIEISTGIEYFHRNGLPKRYESICFFFNFHSFLRILLIRDLNCMSF